MSASTSPSVGKLAWELSCKEVYHPGETCVSFNAIEVIDVFKLGLKTYTPIFLIIALVRKRHLSLRMLKSVAESTVRTSAFVALTGPGITSLNCTLVRLLGGHYRLAYLLEGYLMSFMAVMLERKERRKEITLYMASCGIESLWKMLSNRGFVRSIPKGEVLVFALAMAALQYVYVHHQDCVGNAAGPMSVIVGEATKADFWDYYFIRRLGRSERARAFAGLLKGFTIGFLLKLAHGILTHTLRGRKDKTLLPNATKLGLFLGILVAASRGVETLMQNAGAPFSLASAVGGFVAGLGAILYPSVEISLYVFVKAAEAIVNLMLKTGALKPIPYGVEHVFALFMSISWYALTWENPVVRRSFWNFLLALAGGRLKPFIQFSERNSKELGIKIGSAHAGH